MFLSERLIKLDRSFRIAKWDVAKRNLSKFTLASVKKRRNRSEGYERYILLKYLQ